MSGKLKKMQKKKRRKKKKRVEFERVLFVFCFNVCHR